MNNVEILAPCGNFDCLKVAIYEGANAVYLGLSDFNARKTADNFTFENFSEVISYCHLMGVKVYVTLNTIIKENELEACLNYVKFIYENNADAVIVQDFGLAKIISSAYPDFDIHISTQAGISTVYGAMFAKKIGAKRIVLARETALEEIKRIKEQVSIEIEYFVQGALCVSYSGNCYLSSITGANSGNRGLCKQPCRKTMTLTLNDSEVFGYNLSTKDLSLSDNLLQLIEAGVYSLKIEGRLRSPEYVQESVRLYKNTLEGIKSTKDNLKATFNRGDYSCGYLEGRKSVVIFNKIQGNLGREVGCVKSFRGNEANVLSDYIPSINDGFKIIRKGEEVGGGQFLKSNEIRKGSFSIYSKTAQVGDSVHLTLSTKLKEESLSAKNFAEISMRYCLIENQFASLTIIFNEKEYPYTSDILVSSAKTKPMTAIDIEAQLTKTMDFNLLVKDVCGVQEGNVFLAKSQLNQLRRDSITAFLSSLTKKKEEVKDIALEKTAIVCQKNRVAIILGEQNLNILTEYDIVIIRPEDYNTFNFGQILTLKCKEKYLYLPNFYTEKDLTLFKRILDNKTFDGIYSDGYNAILLAKELKLKCFLGVNANITNHLIKEIDESLIAYFACSKELNDKELTELTNLGGFVFTKGAFEVMTFVHCPIINAKLGNCSNCPYKNLSYKDDMGRVFEVKRTKMDGCLFILLNNSHLNVKNPPNDCNQIYDFSHLSIKMTKELMQDTCLSSNEGHMYRGVK